MVGDSLAVAYLHPGEVSHSFMLSMRDLWVWDLTHDQRLVALIAEECGASRVVDGRNAAVRKFLKTDAEWLGFVDADMGFDGDMFDRLIRAAHPSDRPMVGALAFAQKRGGEGPQHSMRFTSHPTVYRWVDEGQSAGIAPVVDYPRDSLVECDATGGSCFVVHRTVLEKLAATFPAPRRWFDETVYKGQVFGEDITFFRRATEAGFPLHVHTGVQTSHHKRTYLTEEAVGDLSPPTFVVVPFKNRHDLTSRLVDDLASQGGYRKILLFDNGSDDPDTAAWVATVAGRDDVEVHAAAGANIHQMWNAGLDRARDLARATAHNVAVLNNDIRPGRQFLTGLSRALRDDPLLAVVGPNYDGRTIDGVQQVDEVCAGRYDGTGGLPGFAFMVRGETNYRFPTDLNWWFGDLDLVLSARQSGARVGIVGEVTVEHVDGGSQTGDWDDPDMRKLLDVDRETFFAKWPQAAAA